MIPSELDQKSMPRTSLRTIYSTIIGARAIIIRKYAILMILIINSISIITTNAAKRRNFIPVPVNIHESSLSVASVPIGSVL